VLCGADGLNQDGTISVVNTERITDPVNGKVSNITGQSVSHTTHIVCCLLFAVF
jgi:hypothetical protein